MVLDPLEIPGTLVSRLLDPFDDRLPLELVIDEGGLDVGVAHERVRQRDRVLHRELRPRADREVRGVRGVAEQHDVAVVPAPVADPQEIEPDRAVGEQAVPVEVVGEERLRRRRCSRARSSASRPARRQVDSGHSTMNVLACSSNG